MRVCRVRRASPKRPFSMSSMEVSKRTLSGCCESLLIGLAYLWRHADAPRRSATTPNTVAWRSEWRLNIDLLTPKLLNTERRRPGPRSGAFRARQLRDRDCEKQPTL